MAWCENDADSTEDKWHFLVQCMEKNSQYGLCHLTHSGEDPTEGSFTENSKNPVVDAEGIWAETICENYSRCPRDT